MIGATLVDRYQVVGELGRGGMGVVYRARDPLLNRDVAVKLIPPSLLTPQTEERFRREAQLVAQMNHPAIVTIFDIGRHEGSLFFLMPVVSGSNLRQFLREEPRSLGQVLDVIVQVADALDYSHRLGVVHRDIKPENVMVTVENESVRVFVMDFGLAKASSEDRLTKTGTLVGTVSYFSPEQVISNEVDGRSDIYSLGTVLYECLAGEPPFSGEVQAILYRIAHENPRSLRSMGVQIGEELEEIVTRALAKDPAKRYQRAGEMARALQQHRSRLQDSDINRSVVLSTVMTAHFQRPAVSPFIGREKELAELQRRLNAAVDGECQFAVIAGEPGIGKTRLLEEIENLAKVRKIPVLHGRFTEQNRAFAYQGFREVIQEYFRSTEMVSGELPDFSDLAPDLVSLFPVLSEVSQIRSAANVSDASQREARKADDRTYAFELLARTITRIAAGKPLVLVFENLHGAEMSLEAIEYVVQRLAPTPTLICGTYRQTEIDKRHPLVKMLDAFSDEPSFASIILGPFTPSEHRRLVETMVGSNELAAGLAERLFEATDANPFFTKELVRSLIESGGIARDDTGAWTLSGEMAISSEALPATIQQAVEKRIERLPEDVREILSVASVLGKTFEFRDLELLAEGKGDIDRVIDRLIVEGVIEEERESRGDRLTFSSGIVRDVLYNALSRRGRRSLHRRYAELLEKQNQGRLDRVYPQLVLHFSEGDVPEKTVEYGLALARKSLEAFSADETVHVARTVLEFLKEDDWVGDHALQGEARLLLASAYKVQGNVEGALREAELAVKVFEREKQPSRALEAMLLAAETAWQSRRADETRRWIDQGLVVARQADDTEHLTRLLSLASTVAHLRGDYGKSKEYLDELERLTAGQKERVREEDVTAGGTLVVALANPVSATSPSEIGKDEEVEVLSLVFETLVSSDENGHLVPWLAERWDVLDGGLSVVLTLRRDVRFHDGAALTAAAVKESFQNSIRSRRREMRPAFTAISGIDEFRNGEASEIPGLVVLSDEKLEIRMAAPLPTYPALLTDEATAVTHSTGEKLAGTGPFTIADTSGDVFRVEKAAAPYWKQTSAPLDAIEFRIFSSAAAIASAVKSGEVDIARDLLPQDLEEILREPRFRSNLVEAPKKNTYFVIFNNFASRFEGEEAKSKDMALRRAMFGALRVRDLVWQTLGRLAQPATCLLPPGVFGHDPGRRRSQLSREEAQQILRSAEVPTPLKLRAAVHPLLLDRYRALTSALLESWRELGIEVSIETRTFDDYNQTFESSEGIDLLIGRWNADYDDPDNFSGFLFNTRDGVFNRYYSSEENDRLFEEARREARPSAREAIYRRFETQLFDGAILLPLFHDIDYRIASPFVRRLHLRSSPPYVNYAEIGKAEGGVAGPAPVRASGGIIHVPIAEDIQVLDPSRSETIEESEVISSIFQTITHLEGTRVVPWLASRVDVEEGGRRYRVILRDNVRFHDGRRLTSRDVRYSWERLLTEGSISGRWILAPIVGAGALIDGTRHDLEGFRIISNREFTIDLDGPLAFFPAMMSFTAASIVPEGTGKLEGNWRSGCVGTGPFRIVQFRPGGEVELERNPSYWRAGYPKSDGLVFHLGVSPEEIRSSFRSGRFSIASELYPADVEAFRQDPELAGGYREVPRLSVYFVAFNINKGPMRDAALRRRVIQAFDVPSMIRKTLGRLAIPANGLIPPGLLGHRQTAASPPAPVAERRSEEETELTASVHPIFFEQYATLWHELERAFRSRGFRMRVVNRTMAEYNETQNEGTTDITIGRWIGDYPDADTFVSGVLHTKGGSIGRYCGSPVLDRLAERGRSEIDPGTRHSIYREVEETVSREALLLPLFHEQVYRFARPEVKGLTVNFVVPEVVYEDLYIAR